MFGATAYCQLQTQPTLIINPHLVVTVLFDEYDIAGIDIPIALPVVAYSKLTISIDSNSSHLRNSPASRSRTFAPF